jgi:Rrf2 family transcriptional regulator, nitric oxide-sensitive transcriptional repressor
MLVMRLALWTDYALRTLTFVGAKRGRLATIAEIAASFDISKAHLMKGREQARAARLSRYGPWQGRWDRLARSPAEIRVGAVVRETEEDLAVIGCLAEAGFCRIEGCCVLRHALREATLAFLQTLDGYTLADLLAPGAQLVASLGLGPELEPAA